MIFNRIIFHWGKEPKCMCSWTVCNSLGSFVSLGGFPSIWSIVYCLGRLLPLAKLVTGLNDTLCSSMINPLTFFQRFKFKFSSGCLKLSKKFVLTVGQMRPCPTWGPSRLVPGDFEDRGQWERRRWGPMRDELAKSGLDQPMTGQGRDFRLEQVSLRSHTGPQGLSTDVQLPTVIDRRWFFCVVSILNQL